MKKILALSLGLFLSFSVKSYASELVEYDRTNLDDILIENGIEVDKAAVEKRKNEELVKNPVPNESPNKDQIGKISPSKNPPVVYPKTAVYSNVVDISEHQKPGSINYDDFAADIDGAILRSSITTFDEDKISKKKTYYLRKDFAVDSHYKELNKRDVPLGFYHYSRAVNEKEALKEADFVLDFLKDKKVSLPIYIDIEDNLRQAKASKTDLSKAAQSFVDSLQSRGYVAGIYSYPHFAKNHLTREVRNKNEFWIADYVAKGYTGYKDTDLDSWQYTHTGKVRGHRGNIDKNILYKDYPLLITGRSRKGLDKLVREVIDGHWSYGKDRERRLTYAGYNYKLIQKEVNKRLKI